MKNRDLLSKYDKRTIWVGPPPLHPSKVIGKKKEKKREKENEEGKEGKTIRGREAEKEE